MNMIRNLRNNLNAIRVNKIPLSAVDTKIYILKYGIHKLAYEKYNLRDINSSILNNLYSARHRIIRWYRDLIFT